MQKRTKEEAASEAMNGDALYGVLSMELRLGYHVRQAVDGGSHHKMLHYLGGAVDLSGDMLAVCAELSRRGTKR